MEADKQMRKSEAGDEKRVIDCLFEESKCEANGEE